MGAGYVGLPTAATLSHFGHRVILAESDPGRFNTLLRGEIPIVERGLLEMVRDGVDRGTLRFVSDATEAARGSDFVFFCVPTPQGVDGSADLSYVEAVAKEVGPVLRSGAIVVNKSTVPVGSASFVERIIGRDDIHVVSNPEFLREGSAVHDSLNPDRIVVGADDQGAAARVGQLFAGTGSPLIVTDTTTSETIKYASNAFLATKVSFINAVAGLCEAVGADVRDVVLGMGYDKRIGFEFLRPGPGWGGSCLPKDTQALVHMAESAGYDFSLLKGAIAGNEEQLDLVVKKAVSSLDDKIEGTTVGVLGLTFKAGTDDRRSSPAVDIARRLVGLGARVQAYDPTVPAFEEADDLAGVRCCADVYEAVAGARVAVVLTEWDEFRWVDFEKVKSAMDRPVVIDARNILDPAALKRMGFTYVGMGRG
ncbi:MAG: UDP-glucose/GDP-mannose dehydrogenase family protein [Actinobacteria bacterium]|nr:UDP-glucose/GDP-mannose dehydrogenase family protein [Actinomycetota bacterium]